MRALCTQRMRKVADSNFLQNPELEHFLLSSSNNFIVLTDYAAMEAYKKNTLKSISKSMCILCRYPKQVLILKDTSSISGLCSRRKGLIKRFIDKRQSKGFSKFCKDLEKAENGDGLRQKAMLHYGKEANEHMEKMLVDAEGTISAISEVASSYTKQELRILRKRESYSQEMISKIIKNILEVSSILCLNHPNVGRHLVLEDIPNSFIFRYSLCMYLLVIHWISNGGVKGVNKTKILNDMVDMNYVAYATYFDGFLSKDKKALVIYSEASFLLDKVFSA